MKNFLYSGVNGVEKSVLYRTPHNHDIGNKKMVYALYYKANPLRAVALKGFFSAGKQLGLTLVNSFLHLHLPI